MVMFFVRCAVLTFDFYSLRLGPSPLLSFALLGCRCRLLDLLLRYIDSLLLQLVGRLVLVARVVGRHVLRYHV